MAATLAQIRDGLRDRLSTITGLRTYGYMHPKPEPPAVCISGPKSDSEYGSTFDDSWNPRFDVWLFANAADLVRAQQTLDTYLDNTGTKSIRAAIEADPDLGGLAVSCRFSGVSQEPRLVDTAGVLLLGAALALEVIVT